MIVDESKETGERSRGKICREKLKDISEAGLNGKRRKKMIVLVNPRTVHLIVYFLVDSKLTFELLIE